tara:strand:+ start:228 stop:479 length:252 start_codon:yes stop_codon:yes gene_type:complete
LVARYNLQKTILETNKMTDTTERLSKHIFSHNLYKDDMSDIALAIVDRMVSEGLIPDCIDTDDEQEFEVQDIIREELIKLFKL